MKEEIKTLISTIKEMEIALNSKGAEAAELQKKFTNDNKKDNAANERERHALVEENNKLKKQMQHDKE